MFLITTLLFSVTYEFIMVVDPNIDRLLAVIVPFTKTLFATFNDNKDVSDA